jgi:coatomer subunit beta
MAQIRACIGSIPIIDPESGGSESPTNGEVDSAKAKSPGAYNAPTRVLADGTYATESAYSASKSGANGDVNKPFYRQPLRGKLVIVTALTIFFRIGIFW